MAIFLCEAGAPAGVTTHIGGYGSPLSRGRLVEKVRASRSRRMFSLAGGVDRDVAAPEQIIEAADAIPSVAIGFEQQPVLAALIGVAVVFRQQVDQEFAAVSRQADRKRDLARLPIEILNEKHRIISQG